MILLDANLLAYAINQAAPQHEQSFTVVQAASERRVPGVLVPQVLMGFLSVVTNPRRVSRPLDHARAWRQIETLRREIPLLNLKLEALDILGELLNAYPRAGPRIFDLFLVAQMHTHGITSICTYNTQDFSGFPDVEALTPEMMLASLERQ